MVLREKEIIYWLFDLLLFIFDAIAHYFKTDFGLFFSFFLCFLLWLLVRIIDALFGALIHTTHTRSWEKKYLKYSFAFYHQFRKYFPLFDVCIRMHETVSWLCSSFKLFIRRKTKMHFFLPLLWTLCDSIQTKLYCSMNVAAFSSELFTFIMNLANKCILFMQILLFMLTQMINFCIILLSCLLKTKNQKKKVCFLRDFIYLLFFFILINKDILAKGGIMFLLLVYGCM